MLLVASVNLCIKANLTTVHQSMHAELQSLQHVVDNYNVYTVITPCTHVSELDYSPFLLNS